MSRTSRVVAVNFTAGLLLLAQFLLGMVVNLYVTIPARHPGAGAANYFGGAVSALGWIISHGPAWAAVHAAVGLALAAAALASIALAWRFRSRTYTITSVVGALAIIGAGFNGVSFVNYGHAFSSVIMAGLWALALASYLTGLFAAARVGARGSRRLRG